MIGNPPDINAFYSLNDKKNRLAHYHEQEPVLKDFGGKIKTKKLDENIFSPKESKLKIYNKRKNLNESNNELFSNKEIKKHINDTNKNSINKGNEYLNKKMGNKNDFLNKNIIIQSLNINNSLFKSPSIKIKKELKEESTNTYFNEYTINNYDSTSNSKRLDSLYLKRNNNKNKKIMEPKTAIIKNNNYINFFENVKENNKDKTIQLPNNNNRIKTKLNHVNNISINNNINFNNESDINNYKYYLELYNFKLLQAMIQNKSHLFTFKKNNLFKTSTHKSPININLSSFFKNANAKNISIRELFRNLNKEKKQINLFKINSKRKKLTKTYNSRTYNKPGKIFENDSNTNKYKLMNVQYNLDLKSKSKFKENNSVLLSKRIIKINKKHLRDENKNEYQSIQYTKTNNNWNKNIFLKKYNRIEKDELDKGLSNSSSLIKSFLYKHLKKSDK